MAHKHIFQKIQEDESITIDTRNALQLGNMVKYTTGKDSKKYLNYGCWCGYKGRGKPVDNIDRYV